MNRWLAFSDGRLAGSVRDARRGGMTLMELLLAMAATSLITLAAGGMLTAVSYGSAERNDLRSLVVKQELISYRLAAAVRASRQVLECDNENLVLWVSDANNDAKPQVSEVRWVYWDSTLKTITQTQVKFPTSWLPAEVTTHDKDYVPASAQSVQTSSMDQYVRQETWADKVSGWLVSPSASVTAQSSMVSYRVTFTSDDRQPQTIIGAAALRSQ